MTMRNILEEHEVIDYPIQQFILDFKRCFTLIMQILVAQRELFDMGKNLFSLCFLLIFINIFIPACNQKRNISLTKDQKQFIHVYVELLQLQNKLSDHPYACIDSSQAILQKYKINLEAYNRLMQELNEEPERWEAFYKEVLDMINNQNIE